MKVKIVEFFRLTVTYIFVTVELLVPVHFIRLQNFFSQFLKAFVLQKLCWYRKLVLIDNFLRFQTCAFKVDFFLKVFIYSQNVLNVVQ